MKQRAELVTALRNPTLFVDDAGVVLHANNAAHRATNVDPHGATLFELLGVELLEGTEVTPDGTQAVHISRVSDGFVVELEARDPAWDGLLDTLRAGSEGLTAAGAAVTRSTGEAREQAERAREASERSATQITALHTALEAIADAERNIANIVEVLEDVAFQTNLLAVNATVEAGRAGEHGRGFANVAADVRRLASRSADATREITERMRAAARDLEEGQAAVDTTRTSLQSVAHALDRTVETLDQIRAVSEDHVRSNAQVDQALRRAESLSYSWG